MWWSDHAENIPRWHFTEGAVKPQCWRLPAEFCSHITAARGVAVGGAHQPCFLVSGSRRDSRTLCPRKHSGLLVYGYHGFLQKERQWWQGGNGFSRNGTKIKGEDCDFISALPARKYLSSQKWGRYSGAVTQQGRASNQPAHPRDSDLAAPLIFLMGEQVWSGWMGLFPGTGLRLLLMYLDIPKWVLWTAPYQAGLISLGEPCSFLRASV